MTASRISVFTATLLLLAGAAVADNKPSSQLSVERMTPDTRFAVIRALEAERVYVRRPLPMGTKGLTLKDSGAVTPDGAELWSVVTQQGAAARPGDRVQITNLEIKGDRIIFEINGGARKKKKWWQHITISSVGGETPLDQGPPSPVNPRGSVVTLVFKDYVPEMTVERLKELLAPVFDFTAHSAAQAYIDSLPPKVREAVKNHQVLVGMNRELTQMAKGRPPKKIRERDPESAQEFEEWIYGTPPEDVEFVRFVGDEVVRVETMKLTGEKIVRTDREMSLEGMVPHRESAAAEGAEKQPSVRPTLTRPGEDAPASPGVPVSNRPNTTVPGSPGPQTSPTPPPNLPPQSYATSTPAES